MRRGWAVAVALALALGPGAAAAARAPVTAAAARAPVTAAAARAPVTTAAARAPVTSAPALPLSHAGRWITDSAGRVVILHGTNMVYKLSPYYPAAVGFGDDDAAFLQRIGFNGVRVGVIWKAVEPTPGVYDDVYLSRIADTVRTLARHGIVSLLDFHQDLYNERFQGEGAPDWAVQDGGLPNPPLGFPANYTGNPALQHALDQFFSNAPGPQGKGLQDWFAGAWAHVAARFRSNRWVVGYELFNEPFPGSTWATCANTVGCPAFDSKLTALYHRTASAIRTADPRTLIWYEPNVLFNDSVPTNVGGLGDPQAGFAFHDYCLSEAETGPQSCDTFDDRVFANAVGQVAQTGEALMLTEYGSTTDVAYLDDMVARADRQMVPWLEWSYCACRSPTDTGQPGIVDDPSKPPTTSNQVTGTLGALVEPYPQVISGTPRSWGFDRGTKTFTFKFSIARASGHGRFPAGSLTEVVIPARVYGGDYAVTVSGGAVVSRRGSSELVVASCRRAASLTVTVSPASRYRARGSCRSPRRAARPLARAGRPPRSR